MKIEQTINYHLNNHPGVKRVVKRFYQGVMYYISPKQKCDGDIRCLSPDDNTQDYFFGYYDKSPWDISDRFVLCLRAKNTWSEDCIKDAADILLIDTDEPEESDNRVRTIAQTHSWNVQQACMLQWLGPDYASRIVFNDYRNGEYVSVIKDIQTGTEKIVSAPIYTISSDGRTALTLDFSRLYSLRTGYGYYNVPEKTLGQGIPDGTAIWRIDLESGQINELFEYNDFASFKPRPEMKAKNSIHKVNHLMISPGGKRCMVLYRWFVGQRKYTRLITFDINGDNMYLLSDDDMVSHCYWKDDEHILAFANKRESGQGYYLMKDMTQKYVHCWSQLCNDGHPSYSPDGKHIVTDTYPDSRRMAELKIMDGTDEEKKDVKIIARVFAPFRYDNNTRCDLHPRWNHASNEICFDSVFEGHRGLYVVNVERDI